LDKKIIEPYDSILDSFAGRRVVVTGHMGFKGTWLTQLLVRAGAEVCGIGNDVAGNDKHFRALQLSERIEHHEIDLCNYSELEQILGRFKPEFVFHLAAQSLVRRSYEYPHNTFASNTYGSLNLLEAIRSLNSGLTLIFVTSDKCYENADHGIPFVESDRLGGSDPYSASKACAEMIFHSYATSFFPGLGVQSGSARAGNVIGGGDWSEDRLIPDIVRNLEAKGKVILRNPNSTRPWQYVLDPLFGYLTLAKRLSESRIDSGVSWNFGPPIEDARSVRDVATQAISHWGSGEIVLESSDVDPKEASLLQLDSTQASQKLGWRTRLIFDEALEHTMMWYKRLGHGNSIYEVTNDTISKFLLAAN
jgi:CDP-glucose 4,6-dehydratase